MIYGIGNDIIEVDRIKKAINKNNGFKEKVFSENEIDICEKKANKYQSYAARFAAKEAFMKAYGTGWDDGISWKEIEIINQENGKPILKLLNKTNEIVNLKQNFSFYVSLSHLKDYAIAQVIIEIRENI